ncbi:hypothetical protein B0H19DRAFT_1364939 [Mycena capillaripes]|nr:hypothetical protein B0H19DRAFT_1364939 [Mycena capillaripes]
MYASVFNLAGLSPSSLTSSTLARLPAVPCPVLCSLGFVCTSLAGVAPAPAEIAHLHCVCSFSLRSAFAHHVLGLSTLDRSATLSSDPLCSRSAIFFDTPLPGDSLAPVEITRECESSPSCVGSVSISTIPVVDANPSRASSSASSESTRLAGVFTYETTPVKAACVFDFCIGLNLFHHGPPCWFSSVARTPFASMSTVSRL